ncbi:proto-oncogene c-fos N-terminal domain protein [Myxococcus xanthus DK 1622]|uniref:Proto-oncogene c-fos N-terminal domain protein n=1 Tax=Myxococcus xanthus (strain DK1622) TaxID=246197 RepID=Q1D1R7_MYXXD|nr:proto-oncogene c-fos N-terminal domain protein [Myxococcus xanthus DK 1622]
MTRSAGYSPAGRSSFFTKPSTSVENARALACSSMSTPLSVTFIATSEWWDRPSLIGRKVAPRQPLPLGFPAPASRGPSP